MSANAFAAQLKICQQMLVAFDRTGDSINTMANDYHGMIQEMQVRGYAAEMLTELFQMESEFQEQISILKKQLFSDNMEYITQQANALKEAME